MLTLVFETGDHLDSFAESSCPYPTNGLQTCAAVLSFHVSWGLMSLTFIYEKYNTVRYNLVMATEVGIFQQEK